MDDNKKVCVIGAGPAGLTTIKCLLDAAFEVKCFEKDSYIGGRWNANNQNAIPRSFISNIPKHLSCYSDFPIPEKYPIFMTADQFSEYLRLYADLFNLEECISFNTEVVSVEQKNFNNDIHKENLLTASQNKWTVVYRSVNGILCNEEFDFVVVSSGFCCAPYITEKFKKVLQKFTGRLIHSIEYKNWKSFENQKVVICGLGNTGGNITNDVADHCTQVYISTSNGAIVVPRICESGSLFIEKDTIRIVENLPPFIKNVIRNRLMQKNGFNISSVETLDVKTKSVSNIIVNDEIGIRVSSGKVKVRAAIEEVKDKTIYFKDGKVENDIDAIILCTGYKRSFPFLKKNDLRVEKYGKYIPLYKGIFLSKYGPYLAFTGMTSQSTPLLITAEMQARYIAEVFKKKITLPNKQNMEKCIRLVELQMETVMGKNLKEYNYIANPWKYCDELAEEIGCRPSLSRTMLTDPRLAWHLLGRYNIFEYRLVGPNKWPTARTEIMNKDQKMQASLDH